MVRLPQQEDMALAEGPQRILPFSEPALAPMDDRGGWLSVFTEFDLKEDRRFNPARANKNVFIPTAEQWQKPEGQRRLAGSVMVVTGGSDGIGLALSMLGVGEGATVVTNYASDRSAGIAEELVEEATAFGGRLIIPKVDLATVKGLVDFNDIVRDAVAPDRPISFFSPSAATGAGGQDPEYARFLNYTAPLTQISQFVPLMREGATITYPQSEPGAHLNDPNYPEYGTETMEADTIGKRYINVAGPKFDTHQQLIVLATFDEALRANDIRIRIVVANAVVGTKLWRALQIVSKREGSEQRVLDLKGRSPDGKFPTHLDMARAMLDTAFDGQPTGTVTYVGLRPPSGSLI